MGADDYDDECFAWSGWTDDGDPISCDQPEDHDGPHRSDAQGIEWTDAEARALITKFREDRNRRARDAAETIRKANVDDYSDGSAFTIGALTSIISDHPESLERLERFAAKFAAGVDR